jgi:hypothetical protein
MQVGIATASELNAANALIIECRQALETQRILQWDP